MQFSVLLASGGIEKQEKKNGNNANQFCLGSTVSTAASTTHAPVARAC